MRVKVFLFLGLITFFASVCVADQTPQPQKIAIYMTVDWEGVSLEQENIEAMQAFRKKFPLVPMLQLLNPAYFVREGVNAETISATIRSTFLPTDTHGLHVHAWKSLVHYCGVPYQSGFSYADTIETCETGDCGYTVSLEFAYSQTELTQLIGCSSEVLVKHGFTRPTHFRAGGWQLGEKLSTALQKNGFIWDSSRTDANLLTSRWHEESGLVKMVRQLNANSTPLDQPYPITATLMEFPNNASLADYTSAKQIVEMFKNLIANRKDVMVLGFHQETAADFLVNLEIAIPKIEALAKKEHVDIEWRSH